MMTTADTLPPGEMQHTASIEWWGLSTKFKEEGATTAKRETIFYPMVMPAYMLRFGLNDFMDIGARTNAIFTNLGFDVKFKLLDTSLVDLAIDPGLQFSWINSWVMLPVMVDFKIGDSFRVALSARVGYQFSTLSDLNGVKSSAQGTLFESDIVLAGAGGGLYFKILDKVGIMPEAQVLYGFNDAAPIWYTVGLNLIFGAQPGYEPTPIVPTEQMYVAPPGPNPGYPSGQPYTPPGYAPAPATVVVPVETSAPAPYSTPAAQ